MKHHKLSRLKALSLAVLLVVLSACSVAPVERGVESPSSESPEGFGELRIGAQDATLCTSVTDDSSKKLFGIRLFNEGTSVASLTAMKFVESEHLQIFEASLLPENTGVVMDTYPPSEVESSLWVTRDLVGTSEAVIKPGEVLRLFFAAEVDEDGVAAEAKDIELEYTAGDEVFIARSSNFTIKLNATNSCS